MKNNIVFKFISILLCAASLLGAVGGVTGIFVMAESDLYNKTAEQVRQERVQVNALHYASTLAQMYSSSALGGCSEAMISHREGTTPWFETQYSNYGYRILDAEGNVLSAYNETLADTATTFSVPASGQYMHLVSTESQAEAMKKDEENIQPNVATPAPTTIIPPEGAFIDRIELLDANGNTIYTAFRQNEYEFRSDIYAPEGAVYSSQESSSHAGYLFLDSGNRVVYNSVLTDAGPVVSTKEVAEILCYSAEQDFVYHNQDPNGLGMIYTDTGKLRFISNDVPEEPQEQPVPASGILIEQVQFLHEDGSIFYNAQVEQDSTSSSTFFHPVTDGGYNYVHSTNYVGFLFRNDQGELIYQSFLNDEVTDFPPTDVYGYTFKNNAENFSLHQFGAYCGLLTIESGVFRFTAAAAEEEVSPAAEPVAKPAEAPPAATEAPAETTAQTLIPGEDKAASAATEATQETIPTEETTAETTASVETVPSSASAIPEESSIAATNATIPAETTESVEATDAASAPTIAETLPPETLPEVTEPVLINGKTLDNYQINSMEYWDTDTQDWMYAKFVYIPMPELTVELYVDETSMRDAPIYDLMALLRQYSDYLLPLIGSCLLVFAIFAVYLCTAAGRKPKTDYVRAGGLNRIPLDLYFFSACFAATGCIALGCYCLQYLIGQDVLMACASAVGMFFLASLIFVAFCFAFVAQIKTPDGFWYRNTLLGHTMRLTAKFAVWLEIYLANRTFPFVKRLLKWLWSFTCKAVVWSYHAFENSMLWIGKKTGRIFHWIGHKLKRFFSLLPLTWQWLVAGFFVVIVLIIGIDAFKDGHNDFALPFALMITFAVIFYAAHCFGILSESTKRMSKGDLDIKVDDKLLVGCFDEFASDLNDLADVAVVAAQKQLKSERMKTELITNVSHDIKTPLTSIINYVDLLQKPHTDAEQEQYLEVLDRQSQRLKKLIDDLMDMSKANTGNMQVDITKVDAVESVNQALGEFADKLDRARLIPVFRHDDPQVPMMADGKLVWRVLSNLLGNAVKYAMPGTRLYIDLMTLEGKVIISLKNISREELNIDADELMERFVRGDDSRNTEGSGLGLNIAKSLMELQKGQLQLLVDGDLFKVTLIFPGA